ncbi:TolC family protein [Agriterribacter sp.]|uniref:TolC family protein n=1 Tax=Agriterribacter sp. TaxID=2821509 RepID=UPI002B7FFB55|nr:TolC family protein [Agriterribacter sp.]HTN08469.1 TolC family protein [Agriterribacter sp.]
MEWKKIISIVTIACSLHITVKGQQMITLQEAIAAGLNKNYDILLLSNDSVAAATDQRYIYGAFLPNLNATAGTLWSTSAQKQKYDTRDDVEGSGIKTDNINAALNLNWTLFDGLKMFATKRKVEELYSLGSINLKNQVVNTTAEIINNYYLIVRQKQLLKAIEEQMSINEERVKLADRKLSVGLGTKPELLQAKVDLNAQKAAHLEQQTTMIQLRDQLNQLTGMQLPAVYEVADSIPLELDMNISDIQNQIETSNPTILQALKGADIAKISLKEAKASRWPTVSFVSAYNFTRNQNQNNINPFSSTYSRNKGYNFGFTATIPILNNLSVNRNIRQAQLDVEYQDIAVSKQMSLVNVWIKVAFNSYQYQINALRLEEENIELAKENVMIALERFRQGVSTFLELREAQKSLEDAYDRLIAARYNTKLSETELLRLKGELIR